MAKRILEILLSSLVILSMVSSSWGFLSKESPTHQNIVDKGMNLKKDVHNSDADRGEKFREFRGHNADIIYPL